MYSHSQHVQSVCGKTWNADIAAMIVDIVLEESSSPSNCNRILVNLREFPEINHSKK